MSVGTYEKVLKKFQIPHFYEQYCLVTATLKGPLL